MQSVRIAVLKARLSEFLRRVRGGRSITVLDRDTPVARIVPYDSATSKLTVRPAQGRTPVGKVRLPKASGVKVDIVRLLLDERQTDR